MEQEQIDKMLAELHRIGNALEILAMSANEDFVPLGQGMTEYLRMRNRRKAPPTNQPGQPGPGNPSGGGAAS